MNRTITIETDPRLGTLESKTGARGFAAAWGRTLARLSFVIGLGGGLAAGWLAFPALLYEKESQPMNFNHVVHTEDAGMSCDACHSFRDDGSFAGIPDVAVCASCHDEPLGDSAAERFLVDEYVAPGREIPWRVYARQPENVYFSHAPHVRLAEIECRRCHGDHGGTTTLRPFERNRISTYSRDIWGPRITGGGPEPWDSMKMSDCSGCHEERGVTSHCLMCHK